MPDGTVNKRADYVYRADASVGSVTRYAGAGVNPIGTSTAAYDGLGRLTGIAHAPAAGASIAYGYVYDAASRMTSMTTPEGTSSFTLDAADQLLSASLTGETYAYDKTGNRTSGGTQTGAGNRLAFDGTYRYAYDAEGNRTAKFIDKDGSQTLSVGDTDVTAYGYDQRNRLVAVSHVNAWTTTQVAAVGAFVTTGLPGSDLELRYTYDFADRRIRRSIDADGRAGVAALLAKHGDKQIGTSIDDLRMPGKVGHGIDHAQQFHDPPHPAQVPQCVLHHRQQVQSRQARMLIGLVGGDIVTDLAGAQHALDIAWSLSRKKQQVAMLHMADEVGDRRRHRRQDQAKIRQSLGGR